MTRRDHFVQLLGSLLAVALAVVGARYGIPVPPPAAPPPAVPSQDAPPVTMPPAPAVPQPNPRESLLRVAFGNSGCTAAVVGPRRTDGRYWVACAAHCVSSTGQKGHGTTRDGRRIDLTVKAIDRASDCSWMLTDGDNQELPFILLATSPPPAGTRVWVAGYGVHAPGVQRFGSVTSGPGPNGQVQYRLAVSSGDSGGPIVNDQTGELLSVVCCTSAFGQDGRVFGAGPAALAALRPAAAPVADDWVALPIPLHHYCGFISGAFDLLGSILP